MRIAFLIVLTACCSIARSQDLTGTWQVSYTPNPNYTPPSKIIVELQEQANGKLTGVNHYYYPNNYYEHYSLSGKVDRERNKVLINEDSLINFHMTPGAILIKGTYILELTTRKKKMILNGIWKPQTPGDPAIDYVLEKEIKDRVADTIVAAAKPISANRIDNIVNVLELNAGEADSITIDVYDNGEIDGDTVTVMIDDEIVISRKKITDKAISFTTKLSKQKPITRIRMIADNLGSIPPNSALMIITTKSNRYNVRLSSDLKTNGVVQLFLKE